MTSIPKNTSNLYENIALSILPHKNDKVEKEAVGYKPLSITSPQELITVLNTAHCTFSELKNGKRNDASVVRSSSVITLDVDKEGDALENTIAILDEMGIEYIKVPSQSDMDYKAHIIVMCSGVYHSDNPLQLKAGYGIQIDQFLTDTGIDRSWLDQKPLYATSGYLAPASCGGKLTIEEANDKSDYHEGDTYPLLDLEEADISVPEKSDTREKSYLKGMVKVKGEKFDIKDVPSGEMNVLEADNTIYHYGKLIKLKDAVEYIKKQKSTNVVYGGFGCPVCNPEHGKKAEKDVRKDPYAFAFISEGNDNGFGGDVVFKCTGNACAKKQLFTIDKYAEKVTRMDQLTKLLDPQNGKGIKSIDKLIEHCKKEPALPLKQVRKVSEMLGTWLRMRDLSDRYGEPKKLLEAFIVEVNPLEALKGYAMTKDVRKKYEELVYLYDGLIVNGYHHYVYGQAGSGKTTTMYYLMISMAQEHQDKQFIFFYLDGALNMASQMDKYIEDLGIKNVMMLTEGSASDYKEVMDNFINSEVDLRNYVFFYDTFKYMSRNVNDKNSNKEAMHSIKALNKLGATFITLGHTNKDGKRESGTAELEQDSDAMIRVDSIEDNGRMITSLSRGGRCRFDLKEKSFSYVAGDPTSVIEEDMFMEIDNDDEVKAIVLNIKHILEDGQKTTKEIVDETTFGKNKMLKVLHNYTDKLGYWELEKGDKNTKKYTLWENDDFLE